MKLSELVFVGFNRRVAALERRTGRLVWDWKAPKGTSYVSLLLDGDVLVASVNGYMYGLNPANGQMLWFNEMEGFGTGVTSLVSVNGAASNSAILAAAESTAAATANTAATTVATTPAPPG